MKTFLEYVAEDIISKYGTDLSRTAVIFPNKRASLFLGEALARQAARPLWAPVTMTISELFQSHSTLQVADPVKLVCDLHKVYTDVTGIDETLDHFYGWGQLLIADFDDVDKNMAPADRVFANLSNLHELDDVSYLNDEQREIIRKFFANFSDQHSTLLKERFLRLWSKLATIYHAFKELLAAQGLAYEGALYRAVAETDHQTFGYERYIFVGFNLLQVVEQRLFTRLHKAGKACFYWDFDHYYMKSEAGHFISQYLSAFPNELPTDADGIYANFERQKEISLIAAATEDIQARYVGQWLQERPQRIADGRRTAIVLCNEGLLPTVVHCLPPSVKQVNITTGYPLQQTAVGSLVQRLMKDHTLSATLERIEQMARTRTTADSPLTAESLFRAYTLLNRLDTLVRSGDLKVDAITMQRLVGQLVGQTSIPFHGEPAVGLQVMGVLETRNLDFDHVLLLSVNEGNMPRGVTDSSFIPYSIRRAFGLTTADHKVAIYAYYFFRLLSRAGDVTILYNNSTADGRTSEVSRFVQQLLVEDTHHAIGRHLLQAGQLSTRRSRNPVEKTAAICAVLRQRFAVPTLPAESVPLLTPTAINRYMRCQLQFYYCYVEGLREPDDTEDGVIDNRAFGNIFHNAAQILYEKLLSSSARVEAADLDRLLREQADIERAVDTAIHDELFSTANQPLRGLHGQGSLNGLQLINRQVIIHYLRQLVEVDRRLAPFTILSLEADVQQALHIDSANFDTVIGGRVDRLDCITTAQGLLIRVIDYKTGAGRLKVLKTVDDIFDDAQLQGHSDYYLQTLLYARIVSKQQAGGGNTPVAPALLFIQHASADEYNPILKLGADDIADVSTDVGDRFALLLRQKINEIFEPTLPFVPTTVTDRCRTCPYAQLCGL